MKLLIADLERVVALSDMSIVDMRGSDISIESAGRLDDFHLREITGRPPSQRKLTGELGGTDNLHQCGTG